MGMRMQFRNVRTKTLLVSLVACAMATPALVVSAQEAAPPPSPSVATVVGDPGDLTSWGFAHSVPLGQAITWTNLGVLPHTVTFQGVGWDTGLMAPGAAASLVLDAPGVNRYLCALHPTMTGSVIVSDDPSVIAPSLTIVEGSLEDVSSWGYAVSVPVGQSVVWSNSDLQPHTATAAEMTWDTGFISPGQSAPLTFDIPGLYAYVCTPHPWMKGMLQVT
jgi:plastocyanin